MICLKCIFNWQYLSFLIELSRKIATQKNQEAIQWLQLTESQYSATLVIMVFLIYFPKFLRYQNELSQEIHFHFLIFFPITFNISKWEIFREILNNWP